MSETRKHILKLAQREDEVGEFGRACRAVLTKLEAGETPADEELEVLRILRAIGGVPTAPRTMRRSKPYIDADD